MSLVSVNKNAAIHLFRVEQNEIEIKNGADVEAREV